MFAVSFELVGAVESFLAAGARNENNEIKREDFKSEAIAQLLLSSN